MSDNIRDATYNATNIATWNAINEELKDVK
jgi:hypothetical protein